MKRKICFVVMILLFGSCVTAKTYSDENFDDYSIVIGTYLFTTDTEEESGYNGFLTTKFAMLAATSIQSNSSDGFSVDDMDIYYKYGDDDWVDYITDESVVFPDSVEITHINGVCIEDDGCSNAMIDVTFMLPDSEDDSYISTTISVKSGEYISSSSVSGTTNLGFTFVCWTLEGEDDCFDFGNTPITEDLLNDDSKVVFEAKWEQVKYSITYIDSATTITGAQTCYYGNPGNDCIFRTYSALFGTENREGYTFVGWSTEENGTIYAPGELMNEDVLNSSSESGSITLYANWVANTYSISYDTAGGSFEKNPDTSYTYGDVDNFELLTPVRTGYTFDGWYYNGDKVESLNGMTGDITLTATWSANEYSITYDLDDGTFGTSSSFEFGSSVTLPEPTKTGYTFVGWRSESGYIYNGETTIATNDVVLADENNGEIILTAVWSNGETYSIEYNLNSGYFDSTPVTSYNYGDNFALPTPVRTGYTFAGWYYNGDIVESLNGMTGDITLTAKWDAIKYTINFYNGDNLLNSISCDYDKICTLDSGTSIDGYEISGWSTQSSYGKLYYSDGIEVMNLTTEENGVVNLYAVLSSSSSETYSASTITYFNAQTGEYYVYINNVSGDETFELDIPSKDGYEFKGWYDIVSEKGSLYSTITTDDKVVVSNLDAKEYLFKAIFVSESDSSESTDSSESEENTDSSESGESTEGDSNSEATEG